MGFRDSISGFGRVVVNFGTCSHNQLASLGRWKKNSPFGEPTQYQVLNWILPHLLFTTTL
jgi:hypothetical protein